MSEGFLKSIGYPANTKNVFVANHGQITFFRITEEENAAAVAQEGIKLDGLTVIIRKLKVPSSRIMEVAYPEPCLGFHFVLEGAFEFLDVNGGSFFLVPSDMYLPIEWTITTGQKKFVGENYTSLEVLFTKNYLERLLGKGVIPSCDYFHNLSNTTYNNPILRTKSISEKLRSSLVGIIDCPYDDSVKASYLECKTRWLLIDLIMNRENYRPMNVDLGLPVSEYKSIENVVHHIQKNLKNKLTIKELSEVVGYNTTKLKSNFKIVHKTTIFKYITKLRMETAKTLILHENIPIAQASYEVGYSNPQHFTKAFKKTMGYLPSELKPGVKQ